jgi:ABC-type glycerol-3-phosphate transport system substrate-binding protein
VRTTTAVLAAISALAACGSDTDYANEPRPATPINISAAITDDQITVSPRRFGAGPVVLLIANQTSQAQRVTVESDELGAKTPGIKQQTAPINPDGTATLKIDMAKGRYMVTVDGDGIDDATVRVGRDRASSSDQLLTP